MRLGSRLSVFALAACTVLVYPALMTSWVLFPALRFLDVLRAAIVVYLYNVAEDLGELIPTVARVQVPVRTCPVLNI